MFFQKKNNSSLLFISESKVYNLGQYKGETLPSGPDYPKAVSREDKDSPEILSKEGYGKRLYQNTQGVNIKASKDT